MTHRPTDPRKSTFGERKPQAHILNILKDTGEHHPNFTLFLGAGASASSGVRTASAMIKEWRGRFHDMYANGASPEEFWKGVHWHDSAEEYSILFECLFDQPGQRREFIEKCVKDATPSWGYIYLVNCMRCGVFNTVFTTNFDDMLGEACYLFSNEVRPIVCAHDSSIDSLRITTKRPKLIKLHGDFLFDNIKNTVRELESLEDNMKEKFKQYATEFGMIVVGYAGNDRSVMDNFNTLLRSDRYFPHGVYWCVRRGSSLSPRVCALQGMPRFHLVEIDGFDEFFADLHNTLDLALQPEMIDPYGSLSRRLNSLIKNTKVPRKAPHEVIARDIERLAEGIQKLSRSTVPKHQGQPKPEGEQGVEMSEKLTWPYVLLAQVEDRKGNIDEALELMLRQLREDPSMDAFEVAFKLCNNQWDKAVAQKIMELFKEYHVQDEDGLVQSNIALELLHAGQYEMADKVFDIQYRRRKAEGLLASVDEDFHYINKAQVFRHQGFELPTDIAARMESIVASERHPLGVLGALIVLGRFKESFRIIDVLTQKGGMGKDMLEWPIFRLLPKKEVEIRAADVQSKGPAAKC